LLYHFRYIFYIIKPCYTINIYIFLLIFEYTTGMSHPATHLTGTHNSTVYTAHIQLQSHLTTNPPHRYTQLYCLHRPYPAAVSPNHPPHRYTQLYCLHRPYPAAVSPNHPPTSPVHTTLLFTPPISSCSLKVTGHTFLNALNVCTRSSRHSVHIVALSLCPHNCVV
jgi:hypothetical protein